MSYKPDSSVYFLKYPNPNIQGKSAGEIASINRGEYLVKAGDCIACHTDTTSHGPVFSGGLPMLTPFGTIYTPNITSDKTTGIGNWTDAEFIQAMHRGISPLGSYYFPAFPYIYYNIITDNDLMDIKAYLDSIPPIIKQNQRNHMLWPFNWRFLQLGWRILFFKPKGIYQSNLEHSSAWNRGAYLVEGLGHCGMCHTPSHFFIKPEISLGAPVNKYKLTGADIQGYLAPNITQTNLGSIPNETLIKVFTQEKMLGGENVRGPMLEAEHDSLRYLSHSDLLAIVTYLKSIKSNLPLQSAPVKTTTGEWIYNAYCSGCHSIGVAGAPKFGDRETWLNLYRSGKEKMYLIAIDGGGNMPPKGTCDTCYDWQIKDAVDYMIAAALPELERKR